MVYVNTKKKVAFISSYSPRKCGIATFTSDLIRNITLAAGERFEPVVAAMGTDSNLEYITPVALEIRKNVRYDYVSAADYINCSDVDAVSVQHEFGLFGGEAGSYLGTLLKRLNKPVVATLHTVLDSPSAEYFDSMIDLCDTCDRIIVMNERGIEMLQDIYGVPRRKISLIPHGIPDLPFIDTDYHKRGLGIADRKTILTFGLLSRNKGIEVMIKALPRVVEADPSVLYIVLGATHPEVLRHEGHSYLLELEEMIADLGLKNNVTFCNHFVSNRELFRFLHATDLYATPYLHKQQLTSGTLAFAVGAGKAVISTPYWAAEELLAEGRGRLVPFCDSERMARATIEILTDDSLAFEMRKRAYEYGRSMTWPKVGAAYWNILQTLTVPARSNAYSSAYNVKSRDHRRIYLPASEVRSVNPGQFGDNCRAGALGSAID